MTSAPPAGRCWHGKQGYQRSRKTEQGSGPGHRRPLGPRPRSGVHLLTLGGVEGQVGHLREAGNAPPQPCQLWPCPLQACLPPTPRCGLTAPAR